MQMEKIAYTIAYIKSKNQGFYDISVQNYHQERFS